MKSQYDYDTPYDAYLVFGMDLCWTMRDGTGIKIKDMEDSHITACIRMIKRNTIFRSILGNTWVTVFEDVLLKRRFIKIKKLKNNIDDRRK